ncbi:hypothetical protein ACFC1W_11310 [Microbacterium sp. NPDC056003]|uniref:hypothetical protein n=1 Tax=Microbacterium sp. NPDC056003 TaxID=3345676 RepID=UPI0035D7526E
MTSRPAPMILVASALAAILAGCAPASEQAPTSTGAFADEAEAFAAAEETYRAYVDALNAVDLSDPATFEDVYAWTTGELNTQERQQLSQMHADGWVVDGSTVITNFVGDELNADELPTVVATVCSNVEGVTVVDAEGNSVVGSDRPEVYTLTVNFDSDSTSPTGLLISSSNAIESSTCS